MHNGVHISKSHLPACLFQTPPTPPVSLSLPRDKHPHQTKPTSQTMWHPHARPTPRRTPTTKSTTTTTSSTSSTHSPPAPPQTPKHPHAHAVSDALVYMLGYLFAPASYEVCTCSAPNAAACTAGKPCRGGGGGGAEVGGGRGGRGSVDEDVRVLVDAACGAREKREARKRWERRRWSEVPYFGGL